MKYDIFISYRRKESSGRSNVPMARTFKLEFERRGYKVFFDYSDCTDNYFFETILPAIRACDYFVLVLTEDSMSRCFNEGDWVRREIEEALANNIKIIPITPDNECGSWPNLPDSLKKLDGLQITTIHTDQMFEVCVDFLVKKRFHLDEDKGNVERETKWRKIEQSCETIGEWASCSEKPTIIISGHEYVDLGLPSGTFWATCNVGANKPEEYGNYFSREEGEKAAANWGNGCSMPTKEQWEELLQNTTNKWETRNGENGRLFVASNGQRLFLPASGYRDKSLIHVGSFGYYRSSSLGTDGANNVWYFYFNSDLYKMNSRHRNYGLSVRVVHRAKR